MEVLNALTLSRTGFCCYLIAIFIGLNINPTHCIILNQKINNCIKFNSRIQPSSFITSTHQLQEKTRSKLRPLKSLKFLGRDELFEENNVHRGTLKNGLKYSFYKKKIPNIETYLEVCSGSSDENDDQRGIAHLCEHIIFMGSNKRKRLNNYGVKTNACTDYNHTLFYVITDSDLGCDTKKDTLMKMLEPLYEVLEAPTQFNQYELDKERKAVFSEARIITTAEYYKNCNAINVLHHENILPKRFPIGDLEMMESYTVEDVKRFHSQHYIPDNSHLFIQGDLDESEVADAIEEIFSKAQNPLNLSEIQSLYKDTEKSRRKGMPAVKHVFGQKEPGFHVWSCDRLSSFSFEVMRKMAVPEIKTFSDYFNDTLNRLLYKILNINFSIIKRDLQLYKLVNGSFYDCVNEGCRIHSLDIKCDQSDWKNSVFYVISEVGRFLNENISSLYLNYAKDSLLFDFEGSNDDKNSSNRFIENEICGRVNLSTDQHKELIKRSYDKIFPETVREGMNRVFSWYKKDLKDVKVFATSLTSDVTLQEVKDVFYESINSKIKFSNVQIDMPNELLNKDQIEDIVSRSSDKILAPMDKNFHLKTFDREGYLAQMPRSNRPLFEDYYNKFNEYMDQMKQVGLYEPMPSTHTPDYERFLEQQYNCNPSKKEDLKYVYSLMNSQNTMIRTKPCNLYQNVLNNDPSKEVESSEVSNAKQLTDGYTSYTLNNNVKVNCKFVEDNAIHVSANIPIMQYLLNNNFGHDSWSSSVSSEQKIKMNKMLLMLISGGLMESGSIGNLDRRQVELFCELNSIMVDISLSPDYLNINFEIPSAPLRDETRKSLLEYCLQMLNMILEKHQIKEDEFERAKQKLINDEQEYKNSIKDYGYGELVDSMTGGLGFFHDFDRNRMNEIKYEHIVEEANKLFNNTPKEVNIVTNVDPNDVKKLVTQYMSSSDIVSNFVDLQSAPVINVDGSAASITYNADVEQTLSNDYRKNKVTLFEDVTDKAIVFVGGHAPNSSGFLSNGIHMSTILEETLKQTAEKPEDIEDMCALRRELWMHPAFPKASADLFSQVLDSDLFINLRTIKNLTYETNINVVTNDMNHSYFVISSYCNNKNYPVVLSEILKYLKSLSNMDQQMSKSNLDRCKRIIKNKIKEFGSNYYFKNMVGIQLAEATTKNILSLVEYEKVLDMITPEDFALLMASQVYGIDESNLYTRALYSNAS